jgi:hypothetical protein
LFHEACHREFRHFTHQSSPAPFAALRGLRHDLGRHQLTRYIVSLQARAKMAIRPINLAARLRHRYRAVLQAISSLLQPFDLRNLWW